MQGDAEPIAAVNEGRQRRLKDFQGEYRPANPWSLMALDMLLKMHFVGLQGYRLGTLTMT